MITEANYLELMKSCSKWNSRTSNERKTRLRFPFFDQQTGRAQKLVPNYYKTRDQRYPSFDTNVVLQYEAERWSKSNHPPADSVEMNMFLRENRALNDAVNQTTQQAVHIHVPDISLEMPPDIKMTPMKQLPFSFKEDFQDELDDDMSNGGSGSDEEDWGSKKKRKSGPVPSGKKKKASAASRPREPHACSRCGARYKSLAGVMYHNAFVHDEPSPNLTNKLLSPSVEVSDFCDLCLGNRFLNKKTKKAEELVTCHDCGRSGHPFCLSFNKNVLVVIERYGWQCIECKSCTICGTSENDDQLLFCDDCDRGFHLYCLKPALKTAPENEYSCILCQKEFGEKASAPASK
ncbi:unnamed protein product [Auanema sp. JU1783]|nr:unnamed protein product [Auanema sp. JU1783]